MRRQFLFPDADAASQFVEAVVNERRAVAARRVDWQPMGGMPLSRLDALSHSTGGRAFYSSSRREVTAYNYQRIIYQQDRDYLYSRDPTIRTVCRRPAVDTWFKLPRTYVDGIDRFFDLIQSLGFVRAVTAADISQARDGGALLYLNISGESSQPVRSTDRIFGFDFIPKSAILEESIVADDSGDPLLPHGIHSIQVYEDAATKDKTRVRTIHGSRFIPLVEDEESRWLWGESRIDAIFDTIWNLRDVESAQKESQFKGNPILVEVDTEGGYDADDDEIDAAMDQVAEIRSGARDAMAAKGFTVKRVGAPQLDDPEPIIRLLVSRMAAALGWPVNMLLASSRGSEQVTDQDRMDWASNIDVRRQTFALPILGQLVRLGQFMGLVPKRATLPSDVEWPLVRSLGMREITFIDKSDANTLKTALQAGRLPPQRILRKFPKNTEPVDPKLVLPLPPRPEDTSEDIAQAVAEKLEETRDG